MRKMLDTRMVDAHWHPPASPNKKSSLPYELKVCLFQGRLIGKREEQKKILQTEDIRKLNDLYQPMKRQAQPLIDGIIEHGSIIVQFTERKKVFDIRTKTHR